MTESELKNAFREAASLEFAGFPEKGSDRVHEFSEGFGERMARLVRAEGRPTWRLFHTRPKRLVVIAAVIFAVMLLAACAVPEVRESVGGFFLRIFSDRAEIIAPEGERETIGDEYELKNMPEGFCACWTKKTANALILCYKDETNNDVICLQQFADPCCQCVIDNVYAEYAECTVNGKNALVLYGDSFTIGIWEEDGCCFLLYYSSKADSETFENWIASVERK